MEIEPILRNYLNRNLLSTPIYSDLGGGLNTRVSPTELKISQTTVADNVIYNAASGSLIPRDGTIKLFDAQFSGTIYGLFHAKFSNGDKLFVAAGSNIYYYDTASSSFVAISGLTRSEPTSKKVNFMLYNDIVYGVDGTNDMFYIKNDMTAGTVSNPDTPTGCKFITGWSTYVFVSGDGTNKIYYCNLTDISNTWQSIGVGQTLDGDEIKGIAATYGYLIILKGRSIFALSGRTSADFAITQIANSVGLVADGVYALADKDLWFLDRKGIYKINPSLSIEMISDFISNRFEYFIPLISTSTIPQMIFNPYKKQVWLSIDYDGDGRYDRVIVGDLLNIDDTGRPAFSEYKFYKDASVNITPKIMAHYYDGFNTRVISGNESQYVYKHDVSRSEGAGGDDGYEVTWTWKSKYLNLGDYNRYKTLRYYNILGNSYGGNTTATKRNYSFDGSSWTINEPMSTARRGNMVAYYNGKVYVFGGYDGNNTLKSAEVYDISSDSWSSISDMPIRIAYGYAVTVGSYIYIIGGYSTDDVSNWDTIYRYDPSTDSYTAMTATLPTAKHWHCAAVYNNKIYIFGGYNNSSYLDECHEYDPSTDTITAKTSMPTARGIMDCGAISTGKIYVIGGFNPSVLNEEKTNEEYDVATDTWTTKTSLSSGRYEHSISVLSDKLYIMGGYYGGGLNTTLEYDPSTDTYLEKAKLPTSRYFGASDTDGTNIYLIGGNGLSAKIKIYATDDFVNETTVEFDMNLNRRKLIPSAAVMRKKFYALELSAKILEGVTQIFGWQLDYIMYNRIN